VRWRHVGWRAGVAVVAIAVTAAVPSLNDRAQQVAAQMVDAVSPAADELPPLPDMEALMAGEPMTADASPDTAFASVPPEALSGPVTPARSFPTGGSPLDRARAQQCLTTAIYYEAASEPVDGKRAVAQVVLNRVLHPAFPASVCGVVYQGSERWTGCQFSFTCDGSMARVPARREWGESAMVATQALSGRVFAPVGLATHYHTWRVWPRWGRTLVSTATVGAHIFHRLRGYWGTAVAFGTRYVGGEPMPGPHQRVGPPPEILMASGPTDPATRPLASTGAFAEATPVAAVPSAAVPRSVPLPSATVADARVALESRRPPAAREPSNLPTSTVRPEFAESGRWKGDAPAR